MYNIFPNFRYIRHAFVKSKYKLAPMGFRTDEYRSACPDTLSNNSSQTEVYAAIDFAPTKENICSRWAEDTKCRHFFRAKLWMNESDATKDDQEVTYECSQWTFWFISSTNIFIYIFLTPNSIERCPFFWPFIE